MAVRGERYSTPIPSRDIELRSTGSGPVTRYTLSPEELARYQSITVKPVRDQVGDRVSDPVAHKTNFTPKEETGMSDTAQTIERFVPTKEEFLKGIAAGTSISRMEGKWNMNAGSLHYWVGKWDLRGIKPEKAQQLLDEMAIDKGPVAPVTGLVQLNAGKEAEAKLLREKDINPATAADEVRAVEQAELQRLREMLRQSSESLQSVTAEKDIMIMELESRLVEADEEKAMLLVTIEHAADSEPMSKFEAVSREVGALVAEKNAAYGDSFAKTGAFLTLLYPGGIQPEQYGDALCLVRIFDKQMRIATRKDAFGESPYRDITGYGILGVTKDEEGERG